MSDKKPQDFDRDEFKAALDKAYKAGQRDTVIDMTNESGRLQAHNAMLIEELKISYASSTGGAFELLNTMSDLDNELTYIATVTVIGMRTGNEKTIRDFLAGHRAIVSSHFKNLYEIAAKVGMSWIADNFKDLEEPLDAALALVAEHGDTSGVKAFHKEALVGGRLHAFFLAERQKVAKEAKKGRPPTTRLAIKALWLIKEHEHPELDPQGVRLAILADLATRDEKNPMVWHRKPEVDEDVFNSLMTRTAKYRPSVYRKQVLGL